MEPGCLSYEEYADAVKSFMCVSDRLSDGWRLNEVEGIPHSTYLRKESFIELASDEEKRLLKAEYVISYSTSFNVPSFAFNLWNSSGVLIPVDDIRKRSFLKINKKDFYSVITQQEHTLLQRPFLVLHPCRTADVIAALKTGSHNLLVTFLSLISSLIPLKLPLEYGFTKNG